MRVGPVNEHRPRLFQRHHMKRASYSTVSGFVSSNRTPGSQLSRGHAGVPIAGDRTGSPAFAVDPGMPCGPKDSSVSFRKTFVSDFARGADHLYHCSCGKLLRGRYKTEHCGVHASFVWRHERMTRRARRS